MIKFSKEDYNVHQLLDSTQENKIVSMNVEHLEWNLHEPNISQTGVSFMPIEYVFGRGNPDIRESIKSTDPCGILLVADDGSKGYRVLDGIYTLCKAFQERVQTVRLKIASPSQLKKASLHGGFSPCFSVPIGSKRNKREEIDSIEEERKLVKKKMKETIEKEKRETKNSAPSAIPLGAWVHVVFKKFDFSMEMWKSLQYLYRSLTKIMRSESIVNLVTFDLDVLPRNVQLPEYTKYIKRINLKEFRYDDDFSLFPSLTHLKIEKGFVDLDGRFKDIEVMIMDNKDGSNRNLILYGNPSLHMPKLRMLYLKMSNNTVWHRIFTPPVYKYEKLRDLLQNDLLDKDEKKIATYLLDTWPEMVNDESPDLNKLLATRPSYFLTKRDRVLLGFLGKRDGLQFYNAWEKHRRGSNNCLTEEERKIFTETISNILGKRKSNLPLRNFLHRLQGDETYNNNDFLEFSLTGMHKLQVLSFDMDFIFPNFSSTLDTNLLNLKIQHFSEFFFRNIRIGFNQLRLQEIPFGENAFIENIDHNYRRSNEKIWLTIDSNQWKEDNMYSSSNATYYYRGVRNCIHLRELRKIFPFSNRVQVDNGMYRDMHKALSEETTIETLYLRDDDYADGLYGYLNGYNPMDYLQKNPNLKIVTNRKTKLKNPLFFAPLDQNYIAYQSDHAFGNWEDGNLGLIGNKKNF